MKTIVYGIFAEDDANKLFIKHLLPQLISYFGFDEAITLAHQNDYSNMAVAKNSDFVVDNFMSRAVQGFRYYELDLCVVSVDCEDRNFLEMIESMNKKLPNQHLENKVFIFIPVQCIEYWLWYLKFNENTENIETSKSRKEVKIDVYGSAKPSNRKSNPIVEHLSQNIDLQQIVQQSASFAYFFEAFQVFLKKL